MEQISGRSPALRESAMALFTEQKVDHENRPQISWKQSYRYHYISTFFGINYSLSVG